MSAIIELKDPAKCAEIISVYTSVETMGDAKRKVDIYLNAKSGKLASYEVRGMHADLHADLFLTEIERRLQTKDEVQRVVMISDDAGASKKILYKIVAEQLEEPEPDKKAEKS